MGQLILTGRAKKKIHETSDEYDIEQNHRLTLLGVKLHNDCKFSSHVEEKLREANKCLYILRSLRKDGYTQEEIDHLFKAIVLTKNHVRTSSLRS